MPYEATWMMDSTIIDKGVAEHWELVGGPKFYHDSCTSSIFSRFSMADDLVSAAEVICHEIGAELTEIYYEIEDA